MSDMDDIKSIAVSDRERAKQTCLNAIEDLRKLIEEGTITTLVVLGIDEHTLVMGSTAGYWRPLEILGSLEYYKAAVLGGNPDVSQSFQESDDSDEDF